jgi:hypothetical protein
LGERLKRLQDLWKGLSNLRANWGFHLEYIVVEPYTLQFDLRKPNYTALLILS